MRIQSFWFMLTLLCLFACCTTGECNINNDYALSRLTKTRYETHETLVEYSGHRFKQIREPFRLQDISDLLGVDNLSPTHRAIRIVPKNMNQLHDLERDSSLLILYHPFDYSPMPEDPLESYSADMFSSNITDCIDSMNEDFESIIDPIFVFWPLSKTIPSDLNYSVCYEAYLPSDSEFDSFVSGTFSRNNRLDNIANITGCITVYDNRLHDYVPLANARVNYYKFYIFPASTTTDSLGNFTLNNATTYRELSVELKNQKFVVRDSLTSNVASIALGNLDHYLSDGNYADISLSTRFTTDVFKAAQYYFFGSNDALSEVSLYDSTGNVLDIYAINEPNGSVGGTFTYPSSSQPYICIWNPYQGNYTSASSKIFGIVLHELGHATHYTIFGHSQYLNTDKVIKESFGAFWGWFNVKEYYSDIISSHEDVHNYCTEGRQKWIPDGISSSKYTPFFIDLYDDYNQNVLLGSTYNDDTIAYVPVPTIINFALSTTSFQNIYYPLAAYIGQYFTGAQYSAFVAPYNVFL